MSLLMKALEKSEEDRKAVAEQEQQTERNAQSAVEQQSPAQKGESASAAGGGFKLAKSSKLGQALHAAAKKDTAQREAERVVLAYGDTKGIDDDTQMALQRASVKARLRLYTLIAGMIVIGSGGYYAYEVFLKKIIAGYIPEQSVEVAAVQESAEDSGKAENKGSATLLPLVEPDYDIQDNILLAVLDSEGGDNVAGSRSRSSVARQIQLFTQNLLAESVSKASKTASVLEEQLELQESEGGEAVVRGFDPDTAVTYGEDEYMIAQLEELGGPYSDQQNYIASSGTFKTRSERSRDVVAQAAKSEQAAKGGNDGGEQEPKKSDKGQKAVPSATITRVDNQLKTLMEGAVESYRAGDFNAAEAAFRVVLASDSRNVQAMVGLSKVHSSRGNIKLAVSTLLKASELDPGNATVVTELISLQSNIANPIVSEQRIHKFLGSSKSRANDSRLMFTLGTIYARQRRWIEAKEVFMRAQSLDPDNPDYAYNFAVVLDYLNEPEEAVQQYRKAVLLAVSSLSNFDPNIAKNRMSELQAALGGR